MKQQEDTIWVAYERRKPYLPIAVADSAEELAKIMGVRENSVYPERLKMAGTAR